jgi:hypothetical protein
VEHHGRVVPLGWRGESLEQVDEHGQRLWHGRAVAGNRAATRM